MVGAEGFEPPTLCSQSRCATKLRYAPIYQFATCIAFSGAYYSVILGGVNHLFLKILKIFIRY